MDSAEIVNNVPIHTLFAGMSGDTFRMRQAGWILNVHSDRDFRRDALCIRITGRHDGYNLRMISGTLLIDRVHHWGDAGNRLHFIDSLRQVPFEVKIEHVAQSFMINATNEMATLSRDWTGIIEMRMPKNPQSFDDFYGFPERQGTIILPENKIWTVQEHLEAIRRVQQPHQDDILRSMMDEKKETKQVLKLVAI